MIDEIQVRDLALIASAGIEPAEGLTVLTGETGAGKTALLTSCKLLMGARGERTCVREGEQEACVQGRFFLGEEERVVVRRVSADGRSRVQLDGQMASVGELAEAIAPSIDLCSQHDSQELLRPASHLRLLDAWAGNGELASAYEHAYREREAARERLQELREGGRASAEQLEQASFALRQIDAVSPDAEEHEQLMADLAKAENIEALARAAQMAKAALSGDEGALTSAGSAVAALEEGAAYDAALGSFAESVREAVYLMEDAARDIAAYGEGIEFDPGTLAQMQERAAAYQSLLRTYGPTIEDVLARAEEARERIALADDGERIEREAAEALACAEEALAAAAAALSAARVQAAAGFAAGITQVMGSLEMGSADVTCQIEPLAPEQWGPAGAERVQLMFRPAQSMQARPLSRIASGGELSRVLLALHVVMEDKDEASTLVFDEIDAGVGGATANALADVLVRLARTHQVLVVTHLAQVAARAERHYVVRKEEADGVAETTIQMVEGPAREQEIARMLSGSGTDASIAHARELLQDAVAVR